MRGRLLTVRNTLVDVRRVRPRMVSALRRIVDTGARDADGLANSLAADRDVRAAHPHCQARPGLRNIDRQSRKNRYSLIESEIAHHPTLLSCPAAPRAKKPAHQFRALGFHHAADHFEAMVQSAVSANIVDRAQRACLVVTRTVN